MNWRDRITPEIVTELKSNEIFVFGSNLSGIHGAGAARYAVRFGAQFGNGIGLVGKTYAIPTKNENIKTLPLDQINTFIDMFCEYAQQTPNFNFLVTEIGCGLAGYRPEEIAPFFKNVINCENVFLPKRFWDVIVYDGVYELN